MSCIYLCVKLYAMADKNVPYEVTGPTTIPVYGSLPFSYNVIANKLMITATFFIDNVFAGDWVMDLTNNEFRQIVSINSNTEAVLNRPFSNTFTSSAIIRCTEAAIVFMELTPVGGNAVLNGSGTIYEGVPYTQGQPSDSGSNTKFVSPISLTSGTVSVNLTYFSDAIPQAL